MRQFELRAQTGPSGLHTVATEPPEAQSGQVVVRVRAASLNYRDLMIAHGWHGRRVTLPRVPLSDGAGEVVAVGPGVARWRVGDRVVANFYQTWISGELRADKLLAALGGPIDGVLSEYVAFFENALVRIPDFLTYEEAATLPCAALTAWNALVEQGRLKAGDTVVVQGTGGVSMFALQIANLFGARVVATTRSPSKALKLKQIGADAVIDTTATPDWEKVVVHLTNGEGADHVVDVGGAATFERSLKAVRTGGRISLIGWLSGSESVVNSFPVALKGITVQGVDVGSVEMFEALMRAVARNRLQPVIDRVFLFGESPAAYEYLESGKHFGKVVVTVA